MPELIAALPRTRVAMVDTEAAKTGRARMPKPHEGVFSGSDEAEQRASAFTGAIPLPLEGEAAGPDAR